MWMNRAFFPKWFNYRFFFNCFFCVFSEDFMPVYFF